jgi:ribosome-associated translation inhibitor RaiA
MRQEFAAPVVQVSAHGPFLGIEEYAREKVSSLLHLAHEPVLAARVRLLRPADLRRPVVAVAVLDVNGRVIHARAEAPEARESVDRLVSILRTRLERSARHWEARRSAASHAAARDERRAARRGRERGPDPAGHEEGDADAEPRASSGGGTRSRPDDGEGVRR